MPIYEYVCNDCGYDFERLQSFSDAPLESCPECDGRVRRVISAAGVIFKGSGWYVTDSRRQIAGKPNGKGGEKGEKKEEPKGEPKDAGGGEAKAGEAPSPPPETKTTA